MIAFIIVLGVAVFCVYLLVGGKPEDEVFHRIRREEGDEV